MSFLTLECKVLMDVSLILISFLFNHSVVRSEMMLKK